MSSSGTERVMRNYLRVPARIPTVMKYKDGNTAPALITDISTTGLAVVCAEKFNVPDMFDIEFSLPGSKEPHKAHLAVRGHASVKEGVRYGCSFKNVAQRTIEGINEYIERYLDCSSWWKVVNIVSFFFLLDASWRLIALALVHKFSDMPAVKRVYPESPVISGGVVFLALYAISALTAFISPDNVDIKTFRIRIVSLAVLFAFGLNKTFQYMALGIYSAEIKDLSVVFGYSYLFLTVCAGLSLVFSLPYGRKMKFIADALSGHDQGWLKRIQKQSSTGP